MDPSVRAWLGYLEALPDLPPEEYLRLIGSYKHPQSYECHRARGRENKRIRLSTMPPREELAAFCETHTVVETRQHYGITNRRLYEWKTALGLIRGHR